MIRSFRFGKKELEKIVVGEEFENLLIYMEGKNALETVFEC
jgi:hypothetical protein